MGYGVLILACLFKAEACEHPQGVTRYLLEMLPDKVTQVRVSLHRGLPKRQVHVRIGQVGGLLLHK